jgi:ABC-type multidrug transport system fused ATPase/permease subunit
MKGRTTVVIFVFNDSELAEQGSHESLLSGNGIYAELHRLQNADGATISTAQPPA